MHRPGFGLIFQMLHTMSAEHGFLFLVAAAGAVMIVVSHDVVFFGWLFGLKLNLPGQIPGNAHSATRCLHRRLDHCQSRHSAHRPAPSPLPLMMPSLAPAPEAGTSPPPASTASVFGVIR